MNSSFSIKSNKKKVQSSSVSSLFTGVTESAREKLQRQQIATDLNYGFEVSVSILEYRIVLCIEYGN